MSYTMPRISNLFIQLVLLIVLAVQCNSTVTVSWYGQYVCQGAYAGSVRLNAPQSTNLGNGNGAAHSSFLYSSGCFSARLSTYRNIYKPCDWPIADASDVTGACASNSLVDSFIQCTYWSPTYAKRDSSVSDSEYKDLDSGMNSTIDTPHTGNLIPDIIQIIPGD
ncbi:hypothetical protein HDU79_001913, partial [Rhizoclosmatium sp. JEL0117]